jgi:hypothetical protein
MGIVSSGYFGLSVASVGNLNGDAYSDIIVGANAVSSNRGAAYIFLGSAIGLPASPSTSLFDIANAPGDNFGSSVASAGDVDGDGFSDIIVGAYGVLTNTGAAYIFQGSNTGLSVSPPTVLTGTNTNDYFGNSVASAGDVNGDGFSDVIIGAWGVSSLRGAAYIFNGGSLGLSTAPANTLMDIENTPNDQFGFSVACAGDANGDGYSDVIVGSRYASLASGAAYLFSGSVAGLHLLRQLH